MFLSAHQSLTFLSNYIIFVSLMRGMRKPAKKMRSQKKKKLKNGGLRKYDAFFIAVQFVCLLLWWLAECERKDPSVSLSVSSAAYFVKCAKSTFFRRVFQLFTNIVLC